MLGQMSYFMATECVCVRVCEEDFEMSLACVDLKEDKNPQPIVYCLGRGGSHFPC